MEPRLDLRAEGDVNLARLLNGNDEVRTAIQRIEAGDKYRARRHLLATALRLSPAVAPEIHAIVAECKERLGVASATELYVYPDSSFNAACVRPEGGRVFLLYSSSLFEAFAPAELRFVTGHELGHHIFDHHALPVAGLLDGANAVRGPLALQVYAWSRYAELSADRAGLVCAGDLQSVTATLFKLASGLHGNNVKVLMDEFLQQIGDLQLEDAANAGAGDENRDARRSDWFATHPFSPLRLQAVKLFASSELFAAGGTPRGPLEAATDELMSIMDPSYLHEQSDAAKAMRRLLLAGGMLVAAASGGVSDEEIRALERLLGEGTVSDKLDLAAIRRDLPRRIEAVKEEVTPLRRAQVVRDLCVIALADGRADEDEQKVLLEIAEGLGVDPTLVARTCAAATGLD